jgi:hypothetical protein
MPRQIIAEATVDRISLRAISSSPFGPASPLGRGHGARWARRSPVLSDRPHDN